LLAAFKTVRDSHSEARLVLVPHEPTPAHLTRLDGAAARHGLQVPVRESTGSGPASLVVVDRVGALATIYSGAVVAYVGGGFGRAGLHSVIEPAASGLPVLFGPYWRDSRDAGLLLAAGAAWEIGDRLAKRWGELLAYPDRARSAGARGRETVEAGLGAAARSAGLVERLLLQGPATAR
jgi:3-deoxy-D-manno-octulosonic-acid transferase